VLRIRRLTPIVLAGAALVAAAGCGGSSSSSPTPTQAAATLAGAAKRQLVGAVKNPLGATGRTLGLSVVTIPAGVKLPLHFHEGTQVAYIQSGVLKYSVKSGQVRVMSGLADQSPTVVRTIGAGQTSNITPGQWFIEQPSIVHSAQAKTNVVVLLATLLRNGAPAATPVKK
jgi:quercetin dioxygenase-like cupin family protein